MSEATRDPSHPGKVVYKSTLSALVVTGVLNAFFPGVGLALQGLITGAVVGLAGALGKELRNQVHGNDEDKSAGMAIMRIFASVLL